MIGDSQSPTTENQVAMGLGVTEPKHHPEDGLTTTIPATKGLVDIDNVNKWAPV